MALELMAGRKPLPTKLKLIKGTAKSERLNRNEPVVDSGIPDPPKHLDDTAIEEWNRLSPILFNLGLMAENYRSALAGYCEAYSMWVDACEVRNALKAKDPFLKGLMETTTNGNVIQSPIVGTINRTRKAMQDFLSEFGLSPSSIAKVTANKPGDDKKDWMNS